MTNYAYLIDGHVGLFKTLSDVRFHVQIALPADEKEYQGGVLSRILNPDTDNEARDETFYREIKIKGTKVILRH